MLMRGAWEGWLIDEARADDALMEAVAAGANDYGVVFRFRIRASPLPLPVLMVAEGVSGEAENGIARAHDEYR